MDSQRSSRRTARSKVRRRWEEEPAVVEQGGGGGEKGVVQEVAKDMVYSWGYGSESSFPKSPGCQFQPIFTRPLHTVFYVLFQPNIRPHAYL